MSDLVTVQLDTVAVLAVRLGLLGEELGGEAHLASATATTLGVALAGAPSPGLTAAGQAWTAVLTALTERTRAVAATLSAAVASYRALDAQLAVSVGRPQGGHAPVAR